VFVTARRRGIGVVAKESVRSPNTQPHQQKAMAFNGYQGLRGLGGFDDVGHNTYQNMKATQEVNEG